MSENRLPVTCPCCDHEFEIDLDDPNLDDYQIIVRLNKARGRVNVKRYRFKCPECPCYVIVEIEED